MKSSANPLYADIPSDCQDPSFDAWVDRIQARVTALGKRPLFVSVVDSAWDVYLQAFPSELRQYHNCNTCRSFFKSLANVVYVDEKGGLVPLLWDEADAPEHYKASVRALAESLASSTIAGPFLLDPDLKAKTATRETVGVRVDKAGFHHFSVRLDPSAVFTKTGGSDHGATLGARTGRLEQVRRALVEWDLPVLERARDALRSGTFWAPEKVLPQLDWLLELKREWTSLPSRARTPYLWRKTQEAPEGFCHPRSGMLGTLMDSLLAGASLEDARKAFNAKMDPLRYMRPTAAPGEQQIAKAEKLFEEPGLAPALLRRVAYLEDVAPWFLWSPAPPAAPATTGGVFGHLRTPVKPGAPEKVGPAVSMSLAKFMNRVLPTATSIKYRVPHDISAITLTTAVNPDAPSLMMWNNPFSWYFKSPRPSASAFCLSGRTLVPVVGISRKPSEHATEPGPLSHNPSVIFYLKGCRDLGVIRGSSLGSGLFPELLDRRLHEVRNVIEAHERSARLAFDETKDWASGLAISERDPGNMNHEFEVTSGGIVQTINIVTFE